MKKLRYKGDQKDPESKKGWNAYYTPGKIYIEHEFIHVSFYAVKDNSGDIKYVPLELFEDVTSDFVGSFSKRLLSKICDAFIAIGALFLIISLIEKCT